jgi:hypothetical protein
VNDQRMELTLRRLSISTGHAHRPACSWVTIRGYNRVYQGVVQEVRYLR